MPRTSKNEAPLLVDAPVIQGRYADLGDYTVSFDSFPVDADATEAFRGLPDDRCQCPHWGVVIAGRLVMRYADHDETYEAGDAYYAPPGHVPVVTAGTETLDFSPSKELAETMAVLDANLAAMAGAS
ncbi:MAG: cupin domain-containing protein [Mycobacteriales bacterium]